MSAVRLREDRGETRVVVLASGRGTNLQAILDAQGEGRLSARVVLVISDVRGAGALERARRHGVRALDLPADGYATNREFNEALKAVLIEERPDLVALAGYMRLVPRSILQDFRLRIMNIHPSLLPAFPGLHPQHQAIEHGVRVSGCTVHFVDETLDGGPIILQAPVPVHQDDTLEILSARILEQEHRLYPRAIRLFAERKLQVCGRLVRILGSEDSGL